MSAVASELSALASTTVVDFYRRSLRKNATDAHYVRAAKFFTAGWGTLAVLFAAFASLLDNLKVDDWEAMLDVVQRIQRADASQRDKLLTVERGDSKREIFHGGE